MIPSMSLTENLLHSLKTKPRNFYHKFDEMIHGYRSRTEVSDYFDIEIKHLASIKPQDLDKIIEVTSTLFSASLDDFDFRYFRCFSIIYFIKGGELKLENFTEEQQKILTYYTSTCARLIMQVHIIAVAFNYQGVWKYFQTLPKYVKTILTRASSLPLLDYKLKLEYFEGGEEVEDALQLYELLSNVGPKYVKIQKRYMSYFEYENKIKENENEKVY